MPVNRADLYARPNLQAVDIRRARRGEHHHERRHLFRRCETAGRDSRDGLGTHSVRVNARGAADGCRDPLVAEPEIGGDLAGGDAVDADALRSELLRERLRHIQQRRLGGPVVHHQPVGLEERVDRDDVDDRSRTALKHGGDRGASGPQRGEEVELHRGLEVGVTRVQETIEA